MAKRKQHVNQRSGITLRRVNTHQVRQRFLIVCEGERTEPNYFRAFRVPSLVVMVEGVARQALQLVNKALELREAGDYDQIWCVFDRDDVPQDQFNEAIARAERLNLHVAYSNQAFELWYLLHFHYYNTGITRGDYKQRLSDELSKKYEKNDETMYDTLLSRQSHALKHAHNLLAQYNPRRPGDDNPSTTVHLLVAALNEHSGA